MTFSAVLFGAGLLAAGWAVHLGSLWLLYAGYGLVGGIGLGLGYVPPVTNLMRWFVDRKGFATGLAVGGFGLGALLASFLGEWLLRHSDCTRTFLLLGTGYGLVLLVAARFLRLPDEPAAPMPAKQGNPGLLVEPRFWLIWTSFFLNIATGILLIALARPMLEEAAAGLTQDAIPAVTAVAVMGLFNVGDLADYDAVSRAVQGMEVVVHLAADPGSGNWDSLLRSNLVGAYNLFEACRQAGVRRVVAASTIQVSTGQRGQEPYDAVSRGRIEALPPGVPPVSDAMPAEPRNLYASTKVFAESLCRTYAHGHGISCLAIRIGWVVAEDRPPNRRAVDVWCSQRDIGGLIRACVDAPEEVRFGIFYGMSNNRTCWVDLENARRLLGFTPQDCAEDWLDQIPG